MEARHFDLGTFGRPTSTGSADAQAWFDRGLTWAYAFNHEEAVRCFEQAISVDETFAMAHWGVAYAAGPNYNKAWDQFDEVDLRTSLSKAFAASERAYELAVDATPVERALIAAVRLRYQAADPAADLSAWTVAYADAMRSVYADHGDDLDVATLHADASMNVTAWALWEVATGEPAAGARGRWRRRPCSIAPWSVRAA